MKTSASPLSFLMLLSRLVPSSCASMNVHSIVGYRAYKYYGGVYPSATVDAEHADAFTRVIHDNLDAVLGGSDFPDFLYAGPPGSYPDYHDAGEAAHWPPFHASAVAYVRRTVANFSDPASWSPETQKLVAFLFGLTVHYVTDELWEGLTSPLGDRRGFTEMVGAFALGDAGDGNSDEGVANFAGDFYASWTLDERGIQPWTRYFPLEDLVAIYHATPKNATANFTDVTLAALAECKVRPGCDLGATRRSPLTTRAQQQPRRLSGV